MKIVQIIKKDTKDVVASLTESDEGIVEGIIDNEMYAIVDGEYLVEVNEGEKNDRLSV